MPIFETKVDSNTCQKILEGAQVKYWQQSKIK